MKRLPLVISDQAMSDLIDIWTYIAEKSPENADSFRTVCSFLPSSE